ncbi:MAG: hypothetical protein HY978_03170 [Candidatus Liptonbacteria bacterium]|nr:hypothetical protein [Candidatus Liptonbacteria bacterium]
MRFQDFIQELREVRPDESFSRRSRAQILTTPPREPSFWRRPWQTFSRSFELVGAVGLAVFLLMLVAGVGLFARLSPPLRLASLDPVALRAEAQAIDIQVQLTNLAYIDPGGSSSSTGTTTQTAIPNQKTVETLTRAATQHLAPPAASPEANAGGTAAPSTASTTPAEMPIDEALDLLTQ